MADEKSRSMIQAKIKFTKRFIIIQQCIAYFYVTLSLVFGTAATIPAGRTRWLPMVIYLPFNQDQSPLHEILWFLMALDMYITIWGNYFYNDLFLYVSEQLAIQYILLENLIKNLTVDLMDDLTDVEKFHANAYQREINKRVKICVRHHVILNRFA